MKVGRREILVYADWHGLGGPKQMGSLYSDRLRGKEVFSFEYHDEWLQSEHGFSLDPDLRLFHGPQYLAGSKENFGLFLDSSPDRWGKVLMRRREAAIARLEERAPRTLMETDYLLGVYDKHRIGALRFKDSPEGAFQNSDKRMATPPWAHLRDLEIASLKLESEGIEQDSEYLNWLNLLLAPGSSLGGARPKASVVDTDDQLWIAKFPSKNDSRNKGGWEFIANQLALAAGVEVPESKVARYSSSHHTFLTKRFDRTEKGKRYHFASAMTMLGYSDGADHSIGASYLELAEFIVSHGSQVKEDLEQLWRRIVFNICISNTDDHLRNHGFMLSENGWRLSPAYDLNPETSSGGLTLNISENDNALSLDLALEVANYFRVSSKRANEILTEVTMAVSKWKNLLKVCQIPREEAVEMEKAFRSKNGEST